MLTKFIENYNPKIDFKVIYFLNPKSNGDYYPEAKEIYYNNAIYETEHALYFKKLLDAWRFVEKQEIIDDKFFQNCARILEINLNEKATSNLTYDFSKLDISKVYKAVWLFNRIVKNEPFSEFNEIIAVLIFNKLLKSAGYIPQIFSKTHLKFLVDMIKKGISDKSLLYLISVYESLSDLYSKSYLPLNKEEIVERIIALKEKLISCFKVKTLWLYGSFQKGNQTKYSDIDLLVEFSAPISNIDFVELKTIIENELGRRIDLQDIVNVQGSAFYERISYKEAILNDCE